MLFCYIGQAEHLSISGPGLIRYFKEGQIFWRVRSVFTFGEIKVLAISFFQPEILNFVTADLWK